MVTIYIVLNLIIQKDFDFIHVVPVVDVKGLKLYCLYSIGLRNRIAMSNKFIAKNLITETLKELNTINCITEL
jgi:hypothetical protein